MKSIFDTEKLMAQYEKIKSLPPFKPDEYEATYTCTQSFENGVVVTLFFVVRDGEMIIYDSRQHHRI